MINFNKQAFFCENIKIAKESSIGDSKEANRPENADTSNDAKKAALKELLFGKDNRPAYTKQQLLKMGFKEEYILGSYFEQSSNNIADTNITLKMKRGLKVNGVEIKTIYELLDALNKGYEVTAPNSNPNSVQVANPVEVNRPTNAEQSNDSKKAELIKLLYGDEQSYTIQELMEKGFSNEKGEIGKYFEESSSNIFDILSGNVTYTLQHGLQANGEDIKTVEELLDALSKGYEVTTLHQRLMENPSAFIEEIRSN